MSSACCETMRSTLDVSFILLYPKLRGKGIDKKENNDIMGITNLRLSQMAFSTLLIPTVNLRYHAWQL